ncbi:MAG: exodeoxyribonuclease VII large subunit [Bacteroidota bacterium]
MDHLSLIELNKLIQDTLKNHLDPSYWVVAEIGELKVNQKGHCYLELVQMEDEKVIAKSRATIWSYTYRNLSTWFQGITGQELAEGLKILANIKISFHELYGYSLNIQDIDASFTVGEKERQKQEVINLLIKNGVLDMNKELDLPLVPQNVAIISSATAAGYGDFMQHLEENPYGYAINATLYNAIMQGVDAPNSIISALHKVYDEGLADLVVLVRGGGSQLDLEAFDNYELCDHLAQFPIPIITGIGHERDETIADLVAHTKLKTPTAVAEFILQGMITFESSIIDLARNISKSATIALQNGQIKLQKIISDINLNAQGIISNQTHQLQSISNQIKIRSKQHIDFHNNQIDYLEKLHYQLNPETTFKRGYTFTTVNGKSINKQKVNKDQKLTTYTINQIIESSITSIDKHE